MSASRWLNWTPNRQIFEKGSDSEPSKPAKPDSEGFGGAPPAVSQEIATGTPAVKPEATPRRVFPHCPKCASYALYRQNNIGNYECESCGLKDISEAAARRTN